MLTPLLIGLAGSLHCVGMCGPLLLAIPTGPLERFRALPVFMVYHSGRMLMYGLLGLFFGLLGQGVALAGFQQLLSLSAGAILIMAALFAWRWEQIIQRLPGLAVFQHWVKDRIGRLMGSKSQQRSMFVLGAFNGLLPCGMVYAALAGAIATGNILAGGSFMLVFGLGTAPLLLALSWLGRPVQTAVRRNIRIVQPLLLLLAAWMLVSRGLHLDISLFESAVPPANVDCH